MRKKIAGYVSHWFFKACEDGDVELVKDLLRIANVNQQQSDGFLDDKAHHRDEAPHLKVTPFLKAAQNGHKDVLPILIRNGADLTKAISVNLRGMAPFDFSVGDVLRASRSRAVNDKIHPILEKYVLPLDMVDYIESVSPSEPLRIVKHNTQKDNPDLGSKQRT